MSRWIQAILVIATTALLLACGTGAGSGLPCQSTDECEPGEECVQIGCDVTPTCEVLCTQDTDCTGGIDSSPTGAVCVEADTSSCPVAGQELVINYCGA